MPFDFKFPDVGEGIQEGELKKWLVKEGDTVTADQHVAEVETDKAIVEMPSPKAGTIAKLHYKEGDTIQVGATFITIAEEGEDVGSSAQTDATKAAEPNQQETSAPEPTTPQNNSQSPEQSDNSSENTTKEVDNSQKEEKGGEEKYTGSVVGFLEEAKEVTPVTKTEHAAAKANTQIKATLMVRKLAKDKGVDLSTVNGTGHDGMITAQDVEQATSSTASPATPSQPAASDHASTQAAPSPPAQQEEKKKHVRKYDFYGYLDRKPLKGMKKTIAKHMSESFFGSPQVTNFHWADVTALEELRANHKKAAAEKGIKLTSLAYVIKAVAKALANHPEMNAMMEDDEIVSKKYYNIGVAVDVDDGLMVPVVKRASTKNVEEIAGEIVELAKKAREQKLDMMDMKGGTFTISNLGSVGVEFFTPILNSPESAILGIGTTKETPVVKNGQVVVRKMMPLSVTIDHRIANGAQAARFMQELIQYLEFPGMIDNQEH